MTPLVERVDSTIYSVDNSIGFESIYPLDSSIHPLNNWFFIPIIIDSLLQAIMYYTLASLSSEGFIL